MNKLNKLNLLSLLSVLLLFSCQNATIPTTSSTIPLVGIPLTPGAIETSTTEPIPVEEELCEPDHRQECRDQTWSYENCRWEGRCPEPVPEEELEEVEPSCLATQVNAVLGCYEISSTPYHVGVEVSVEVQGDKLFGAFLMVKYLKGLDHTIKAMGEIQGSCNKVNTLKLDWDSWEEPSSIVDTPSFVVTVWNKETGNQLLYHTIPACQ